MLTSFITDPNNLFFFQGLSVAKSIRAVRYLECSAKHNRGVRECFDQAAKVAISGKCGTTCY